MAGFDGTAAFAVSVKVIANPRMKADMISADEFRRVFLEETNSLSDGSYVEPVIEEDGPLHAAFSDAYLGRIDDNLRNNYRSLIFAGRGSMPKVLESDAEVVAYVSRIRGAIGYVSSETNTAGVKILSVLRVGDGDPRRLISRFEPEYPETLKRLKIGGTVRLHVTIFRRGSVEASQLLAGNPILGEAAGAAVKRWVYAPSHSTSIAEVIILFDPTP